MAGTHARKAPSGSDRWMNCPGSIGVTETMEARGQLFEREEPDYTREGLCAHELAAHCLKTNTDGWEHIGQRFYKEETATAEMAEHVQLYLDTVRSLNYPKNCLHVEQRVGDAETGGTIDALGFDIERDEMHVVDLKYGEGIPVDALWNTQLLTYAWEAFDFLRFHPRAADDFLIHLMIVQPRSAHGNKISNFTVKYHELEEWFETQCKPARERVDSGNAALQPGDWCRFCPAKLGCPAVAGMFEAAIEADAGAVRELTPERLGIEMEQIKAVKMYIKALEDEVFRRLSAGGPVPGYKLVSKKADRVWKADVEGIIKETFGPEGFNAPTLKSPAQIEKTCVGGDKFTTLWAYKPQTGMTVAPATDGRPAVIQKTLDQRFKSVVVSELERPADANKASPSGTARSLEDI